MDDPDPTVCSAAGILVYCPSGRTATITVAEKSNTKIASNFHAKILGGFMVALILQATTTNRSLVYPSIETFSDY